MPFMMLELHNSLLVDKSFTYAVPVEWFWEQTELLDCSLAKERFATLRMLMPTAQVLYACAHAMLKHGSRKISLRWLYDLDQLMRVYAHRLDWDLLLRQAKVFQWSSALEAAFSQTTTTLTPVPKHVLAELIETYRPAPKANRAETKCTRHTPARRIPAPVRAKVVWAVDDDLRAYCAQPGLHALAIWVEEFVGLAGLLFVSLVGYSQGWDEDHLPSSTEESP
jgi:hypothetical protein